MTNVSKAEMVKRARSLSEDQQKFLMAKLAFVLGTIDEWRTLRSRVDAHDFATSIETLIGMFEDLVKISGEERARYLIEVATTDEIIMQLTGSNGGLVTEGKKNGDD